MRLMRHTNQVVKELLRKAASQGDVPPPKKIAPFCGGGHHRLIHGSISLCNHPTRPTQPCIPPGSLSRVPASAGEERECHLCRVAGNTV